MEKRLKLLVIIFGLGFVGLIVKLFGWQVVRGSELASQARGQHQGAEKIVSHRGGILARDGAPLAVSSEAWLVYAAKPELKEDAEAIANKLAPFFEPEDLMAEVLRIYELLTKDGVVWVAIKPGVNTEVKNNIEALKIAGIGFERMEKREYPEASAAAHVLGFVGKSEDGSDQGYFGLEGFYDLTLSGKSGFSQRDRDARGLPIILGDAKEVPALTGVELVTNLDKTVQMTAEKHLKEGMERYGASGGRVMVVNPKTGAILGMAAYPAYDPDKYFDFGNEFFKNPLISDSFEPGSIFKPLVMAAALDAGVIKPETKCEICDGPLKVDKYTIETWDKKYHAGATMTEVLVNSDNVGMAFIGQKLGDEKLYDYLEKYGFGSLTEVDLQGEASPALRRRGTWNIVDLATASFGQGIAVTPIQLIKAFSAIANDGVTMTPQVGDRIALEGWDEDIKPIKGERVISEKAAVQTRGMMVAAVKNGEAKWTVPKGFKIAGKTGTAQIPVAGHYDAEKTIASFIGMAPADEPEFLMLVSLREPTSSPWGSETAAPLWFAIARDLFPYLGIQPED